MDRVFFSESRLGERFIAALVNLLFLPGFGVDAAHSDAAAPFYRVWERGIGTGDEAVPPASAYVLGNRTEVLKLLLVLMGQCMYVPTCKSTTMLL